MSGGMDIARLPGDCVLATEGRIVIVVDDYLAADDIARTFGDGDGFCREVRDAMAQAWPDDFPERGSSSLPAVLPPLVTALLLVLSVAYREQVRTLVWLTPLALLLLAVVVGCVWLAGRLTARPPMTEHLRDEAAVLIERSK